MVKNDHDLVLERIVDVPPELVYKAWTTPKHLMPWFCPKPYRPLDASATPWFFTAVLTFEPHGNGGCKYTATALHSNSAHAAAHEKMGFSQGWGKVVEQLVEYVKTTPMN
jgi:uncharacterized protein YndB with AHSA1/START domain